MRHSYHLLSFAFIALVAQSTNAFLSHSPLSSSSQLVSSMSDSFKPNNKQLRMNSNNNNKNNPQVWVNGEDNDASRNASSKSTTTTTTTSSLVSSLSQSSKGGASKLASAFLGLQERDQYDAVLTGLCAKILDEVPIEQTVPALQDPMALLQEMNDRQVPASPRSLMALIDATVKTQDAKAMAQILSLSLKNSAMNSNKKVGILSSSAAAKLSKYGSLQTDIIPLPPTPTAYMATTSSNSVIKRGLTTTTTTTGSGQQQTQQQQQQQQQQQSTSQPRMTRAERLHLLANVPVDDRAAEVTSAMAVLAVAGGCVVANVLGMDDITPLTNTLAIVGITLATVDNFYDLWQVLLKQTQETVAAKAQEAAAAAAESVPATATTTASSESSSAAFQLPDKKDMPLQLGTGQVTGTIIRGLTRLLTVDTERECECEAAALVAAYTLGLPCFAFRPNALEAAVLVAESMKDDDDDTITIKGNIKRSKSLDPLLSNVGIMKMLIWLMAPVAMESMKHTQLIASDPREARGMLQRLEAKENDLTFLRSSSSSDAPPVWWLQDEKEQNDLLQWAYAEADLLLRSQKQLVTDVAQRLAGGAATVGDCVAVLENW